MEEGRVGEFAGQFRMVVVFVALISSSLAAATAVPAAGQSPEMSFDKLELRTTFGGAQEGQEGRLAVNADRIRFLSKNGRAEYFSIPSKAVTDLFYSRVSGRRIKTAILVSPLLLFSKGKKHYMTISFNDGAGLAGAVEFRLDKSNYRGTLHAVDSVSGVPLEFDQEGIKDDKESLAKADGKSEPVVSGVAAVRFESVPDDAEIEIDGSFAGTTPRSKSLSPGVYRIRIWKKGYTAWEREITLAAGEKVPVKVELERE